MPAAGGTGAGTGDSAVRQELKIAFLALRHAYESAYSPNETTDPVDSSD